MKSCVGLTLFFILMVVGCGENSAEITPPTPVAIVSATNTPFPTETSALTPSPTATPTNRPTNTPQPTNTPDATPPATATAIPSPTITSSPTPTEVPLGEDEKFVVIDDDVEIRRKAKDSVIIVREGVEYTFDYSEQVLVGMSVVWAKIFDTNNDGEREFLVATYYNCASWAGCDGTDILYFDPVAKSYIRTFLDGRYPDSDIDGDGVIEFRGRSWEFYRAGGFSLYDLHIVGFISPIEFYHFDSGAWKDVTGKFPERIASDAEYWLSDAIDTDDCSFWGWAAYMADMYMLNQDDEGWQVYAGHCGGEAGFEERVEGLESVLVEMGYAE